MTEVRPWKCPIRPLPCLANDPLYRGLRERCTLLRYLIPVLVNIQTLQWLYRLQKQGPPGQREAWIVPMPSVPTSRMLPLTLLPEMAWLPNGSRLRWPIFPKRAGPLPTSSRLPPVNLTLWKFIPISCRLAIPFPRPRARARPQRSGALVAYPSGPPILNLRRASFTPAVRTACDSILPFLALESPITSLVESPPLATLMLKKIAVP